LKATRTIHIEPDWNKTDLVQDTDTNLDLSGKRFLEDARPKKDPTLLSPSRSFPSEIILTHLDTAIIYWKDLD